MKKYVCRLKIFVALVVLCSCLLSACTNDSSDPSTLESYRFGKDQVPSITSVVGERTVTDTKSENENEFPSQQYTYQSSSVFDDLTKYIQVLEEQEWIVAGYGYDLEVSPGNAQLSKESVEEGQILVLYITYENNQYTINVTKLEALIAEDNL